MPLQRGIGIRIVTLGPVNSAQNGAFQMRLFSDPSSIDCREESENDEHSLGKSETYDYECWTSLWYFRWLAQFQLHRQMMDVIDP
jgi:hypothetical protein